MIGDVHSKNERLSSTCVNEDANGHLAPPKSNSETHHMDGKQNSDPSHGTPSVVNASDRSENGELHSDWSPGRMRKIYYSYFEREEEETDSNDK